MSNVKNEQGRKVEIYPPMKPLDYPLSPHDVSNILGIKRETLLSWDRAGNLNFVPRGVLGKGAREFGPAELTRLLLFMKGLTHKERRGTEPVADVPNFPWLQEFDPTQESELHVPATGYTIRFEAGTDNQNQ